MGRAIRGALAHVIVALALPVEDEAVEHDRERDGAAGGRREERVEARRGGGDGADAK